MPDLKTIKGMEVFKVGRHVAMDGNPFEVTTELLDSIAANFAADGYVPPAVVGHPKLADPRFGDMLSVYRQGDKLFADVGLIPEFHELVKKGMYPSRSLGLRKRSDGTWTIKHIGFLGAVPPAVKGLAPIQFAEGDEGITVEFSDYRMSSIGGVFQKIRDFLIEKFGQDAADKVVNQYEIDDLKRQIEDAPEMALTSFSAPNTKGGKDVGKTNEELLRDLEAAQTQIREFAEKEAKRDAEFALVMGENKKLKSESTRADFSSFCEGLPEQITPAMKPAVLDFMEVLSGVAEFEFAEGEGKVKAQPVERFKVFLRGLPKQVEFAETAKKEKAVTTGTGTAEEKLHALAVEKIKGNKDMTYGVAFAEVQRENVDIATEYANEIRKEG